MRYEKEENLLKMSAREFITRARRGISETLPFEEDEPEMRDTSPKAAFLDGYAPVSADLSFSLGAYPALVRAVADRVDGDRLFFAVPCDATPSHPGKELVAEARGEAYVAALALLSEGGATSLTL